MKKLISYKVIYLSGLYRKTLVFYKKCIEIIIPNSIFMLFIFIIVFNSQLNAQGYCLDFDGVNDYVEINNELKSTFSIEVWIKPLEAGPTGWWGGGNAYDGDGIIWSDVQGESNDFVLGLLGNNISFWDGSNSVNVRGSINVVDGQWHHVVVTRDGLGLFDELINIYVDGQLDGTAATGYYNLVGNPKIHIGGNTLDGRYFKGSIDQLRIWGDDNWVYVVPVHVIREHMYRPTFSSFFGGKWTMDDGTGTIANDSAGGNHGTLINMDNSDWITADYPYGSGFSNSQMVSGVGIRTFPETEFSMNFTYKRESNDFTVTKLNGAPNILPSGLTTVFDDQYWILNKYGDGAFSAALSFTLNEDLNYADQASPWQLKLYRRDSNSGEGWVWVSSGSSVNFATNTVTFPSGNSTGQFIVARLDGVNPYVVSLSPTDNSINVSQNSNLIITFSEPVLAVSGNIRVKKLSDHSILETIPVTSNRVTGSGGTIITIDPITAFPDNMGIYIEIDASAFDDLSGKSYAGISNNSTWNFTTEIASPTVFSFLPADNEQYADPSTLLEIDFSEPVVKVSGNITIKKASDNSIIEQIDVNSASVSGSGTATIQISPSNVFEVGTAYYVIIDADAFDDLAGNSYAGISDNSSWNFSIAQLQNVDIGLSGFSRLYPDFGDYDNDGDLDIALCGYENNNPSSKILRNDNGIFTDINAGIIDLDVGSTDFGDFDNDGDLDLLICGKNSSEESFMKVYINNSGVFSDASFGLPGISYGNAIWGDVDNDGDLDIVFTGTSDSKGALSAIYKNQNGLFIPSGISIPDVLYGFVDLGDFDNDGDLDLLICGDNNGTKITRIYVNNSGVFTDLNAGIQGVNYGSCFWGDYDNDGDLDVLVSGDKWFWSFITRIYTNNNSVFSDANVGLSGSWSSWVRWNDYNIDGDLDININSSLADNNGGIFSQFTFTDNENLIGGNAWGDYDSDGDLDLLLMNSLYKNINQKANNIPSAPSNLSASIGDNKVTFSWDAASDTETPAAGLTYNLCVGTNPGGTDIVSPMANLSTGKREVSEKGNMNQSRTYNLYGLAANQTYYWSVQTIDNSNAGSQFAQEQSFIYMSEADNFPGLALDFEGTDDYVQVNNVVIPSSGDFTVSVWAKVAANQGGYREIISQNAGSGGEDFYLGKSSGGNIRVGDNWSESGVPFPNDGLWHYYTVVKSATNTFLYIDGILEAEKGSTILNPAGSSFRIGRQYGGYAEYFEGIIDELRIWSNAQTSAQIHENMCQTLSSSETDLVSYWQFNEGSGITTSDIISGNEGTLTNMTDDDWIISTAPIPFESSGNGNWASASNWLSGQGYPSKTWSRAKINSSITLNQNRELIELSIESGKNLIINPDVQLTVSDSLINKAGNAGLLLKSDHTGNASLIFAVGTPAATVQRYLNGYTSDVNGWHEIGSPTDMTVTGSPFEPGSTDPHLDDLYYWRESTGVWANYKTNAFNFSQGQGYLVAYQTTSTNNFIGSLTAVDQSYSNMSYTPASSFKGYHLIGNPFTAAILWDNGGWTFTNVGHICAVWDEEGGNYIYPSAGDPIPSTNGFFVEVSSGTNTLTIPSSARSHNLQNNYKNTELNLLKMKVTSNVNSYYNIIKVRFKPDATEQWDALYDAHKMHGAETAPGLWTISNNEEFGVNTLALRKKQYDLPLNFKAGVDHADYTLSFENVSSFSENSDLMLEDLFTGNTINLIKQQDYTFKANKSDSYKRFVLHFYINSSAEMEESDKTIIYSYSNRIMIKSLEDDLEGTLEIMNTLGQMVYSQRVIGQDFISIKLQVNDGVYIVRFVHSTGMVDTKKVILNY